MFQVIEDSSEEGTVIKDWPVIINMPQDGGKIAKHEVSVDYLLLSQEEIDEQLEQSKDIGGSADVEILKRVVRRIGRLTDADKNPLDYTETLRDMLLKRVYFRQSLIEAYFQMASGKKAQRKN